MAFTLAQEAGPKIQGHSMFMSLEPFPSLPLSFMPLTVFEEYPSVIFCRMPLDLGCLTFPPD